MVAVAQGSTINAGNPMLTFVNVLRGVVVAAQATLPTTTKVDPSSSGLDLATLTGAGVIAVTQGTVQNFRVPGKLTLPNQGGAVVSYTGTVAGVSGSSPDRFTGCTLLSGAGVLASADPVVSPLGAPSAGSAGTLVAPYALSWAIYDVSTDDKRSKPVLTSGPTSVDLLADQVQLGVYAVDWAVPSDEPLGRHEVRWTLTATTSSAPVTYRREFDVLRGIAGLAQRGYCLVSDFRDEGIREERVSDQRLQVLIEQWSRYVDQVTRRFFEPRLLTLLLDGNDSTTLNTRIPIIGVGNVAAVDDSGNANTIDLTALRFYNRHITEDMTQPDDRDAPRIEFVLLQPILIGMSNTYYPQQAFRAGRWARGTQNILVQGAFGYTDLDGSPSGDTPQLIRRATQLLVMRNLPKLAKTNERFDALHHHRITTESTRGQSYSLAAGRAGRGDFTGDDEIDSLLAVYSDTMQMASTTGSNY